MSDANARQTRAFDLMMSAATRFEARRVGLRWQIFTIAADGIERPLHPCNMKFWRWITAARLAGELQSNHNTGIWIGAEA